VPGPASDLDKKLWRGAIALTVPVVAVAWVAGHWNLQLGWLALIWIAAGVPFALERAWTVRQARRTRLDYTTKCRRCGYDRQIQPFGKCPECGHWELFRPGRR